MQWRKKIDVCLQKGLVCEGPVCFPHSGTLATWAQAGLGTVYLVALKERARRNPSEGLLLLRPGAGFKLRLSPLFHLKLYCSCAAAMPMPVDLDSEWCQA